MRYLLSSCFPAKKYRILLFISMSCLFIGACNQENAGKTTGTKPKMEDQCKAAIQFVLEKEFTGPDEEVVRLEEELFDTIKEELGDSYGLVDHPGYYKGDPQLDGLYSYAKETYGPYFTEKGFDQFITNEEWMEVFKYHTSELDYQIKPYKINIEKIEFEEDDDEFSAYNFDVTVEYQAGSEEIEYFSFIGWAICPQMDKIGSFTIIDQERLDTRMYDDTYN